ncbi:MAG: hypothetical protein L0J28_08510, partial [Staphylococcus simulans]|nr:hypothetical protein [Staphylococcus simulans]MDU7036744.1 hypothetical protein [Staphylococcus simulans]
CVLKYPWQSLNFSSIDFKGSLTPFVQLSLLLNFTLILIFYNDFITFTNTSITKIYNKKLEKAR